MRNIMLAIAGAVATGTVCANTLAWYRFDDKAPGFQFTSIDETVIKNEIAGSERNQPCEVSASSPIFGNVDWAQWYPTYAAPFQARGVYDPVSGEWRRNTAAISFKTGPNNAGTVCNYGGGVRMLGTTAKPTDAITVECFVKVASGKFNTFAPIAFMRRGSSWTAETWAIYMQSSGTVAVRLTVGGTSTAFYSGNSYNGAYPTPSHCINDGGWHHVALTYSKATGTMRTYVDYEMDMEYVYADKSSLTYDTTSTEDAYKALYVGGSCFWDTKNGGRNFTGSVDELRISDTVLAQSEFLRLQDDGMGDTAWYRTSADASDGYNFGNSTYHRASRNTASGATPAAIDAEVFAPSLRKDMYSGMITNDSAMHFTTNGAGVGSYVKIAGLTTRVFNNTNSSFTVECVFKSAGTVVGGENCRQTLFKIGATPTAQIMFDARTSRYMRYGCNNNGEWKGDITEATKLDDGKWHHAAFVYDMAMKQVRIYFDRKLDKAINGVEIRMDYNSSLFLGANQDAKQHFNGWIDEARVTKGALKPSEFICATAEKVDLSDPTLLLAGFDGNLDSAVYPGLIGSGTSEKQGQSVGSLPTYGRARAREILLGGSNSTERTANAAAIVGKSSRWGWAYSPLFEQDAFTVEFFARISAVSGNATLVRYAGGSELYNDAPWMLYSPGSNNSSLRRLQFCTRLVTNGVAHVNYSDTAVLPWPITDNKWHHYAFAYQPHEGSNTVLTLWADYAEIQRLILPGRLNYGAFKGGRLSQGGSSTATTHFDGAVDCLRFSKGVLSPDKFVYKASTGGLILLR